MKIVNTIRVDALISCRRGGRSNNNSKYADSQQQNAQIYCDRAVLALRAHALADRCLLVETLHVIAKTRAVFATAGRSSLLTAARAAAALRACCRM
jgi:hypothetical protein